MSNVQTFLNELAVAVQKHAMYPPGHPALRTVSSDLASRLDELLDEQGTLSIHLAKGRLTVNGVEIRPGRALLDSLAARLHDHQIAGLHLQHGATDDELDDLIRSLALDADRSARPIGLEPADRRSAWAHIRLDPVEYDALRLGEETAADELPASREPKPSREPPASREPKPRGKIDRDVRLAAEALSDVELPPELLELVGQIDESIDDPRAAGQLAALLREVRAEDLRQLLGSQDAAFAARLVRRATSHLNPRAVVDLVEAAAASETRPVAPWLLRLLTKLAYYGEGATGQDTSDTDDALREVVHDLVDDWQLADPRPEAYAGTLGQLTRATAGRSPEGARPYFADRLVMMGLELEMMGRMVVLALQELRGSRLSEVLGLLEAAADDNRVAQAMWSQVATAETLARALDNGAPEFDTIDRLLPRVGLGAAGPLLDALVASSDPAVRVEFGRRLVHMGSVIAGAVVSRLEAGGPDATAALLAILNELGVHPHGLALEPFFDHSAPTVRAEAYRLAARSGREVEAMIRFALAETDPRLLAIGLAASDRVLPLEVGAMLQPLVSNPDLPVQLRVKAVQALSRCRDESALDALLRVATRRRWLVRRTLAPPDPVVLEALQCIRAEYRHLPKARDLLEEAERSEHRSIRIAAGAEIDAEAETNAGAKGGGGSDGSEGRRSGDRRQ